MSKKIEKNNFFITGNRNIGKTFLVKRIIKHYNKIKIAGFFTRKEENGLITFQAWDNFWLYDKGPKMVIYNPVDGNVHVNVFEELGIWTISHAVENADLVIFDELGRFEVKCRGFIRSVYGVLDSSVVVLGVIKAEKNIFLDNIRKRNDIELITLTLQNRDEYYRIIVLELDKLLCN